MFMIKRIHFNDIYVRKLKRYGSIEIIESKVGSFRWRLIFQKHH